MPTRISDATREKCAGAWHDILADLVAGATIARATGRHELNGNALWAYRASDAALLAAWREAMRASADEMRDEHLDTIRNQNLDPAHARTRAAGLQWQAEKRDPDSYAPRTHGTLDVRTLDLRPIMAAAEARLAASRRGLVVEAEVLPLSDTRLERSCDTVTVGGNDLY